MGLPYCTLRLELDFLTVPCSIFALLPRNLSLIRIPLQKLSRQMTRTGEGPTAPPAAEYVFLCSPLRSADNTGKVRDMCHGHGLPWNFLWRHRGTHSSCLQSDSFQAEETETYVVLTIFAVHLFWDRIMFISISFVLAPSFPPFHPIYLIQSREKFGRLAQAVAERRARAPFLSQFVPSNTSATDPESADLIAGKLLRP